MPRKTQLQPNLSELLAAIPHETPTPNERAQPAETPSAHERAEPTENPSTSKRASTTEHPKPPERSTSSIAPAERFTFTQRVRITDGFQYKGNFTRVPDWADRNWLQYDASPPKPYRPGPALFLPDGQVCRVTDWLVSEHIAEGDGSPLHTERKGRLVVYSDRDMQHFFSVTPQ